MGMCECVCVYVVCVCIHQGTSRHSTLKEIDAETKRIKTTQAKPADEEAAADTRSSNSNKLAATTTHTHIQ